MVSCLAAAAYTMLADVYTESHTYDPETFETDRKWTLNRTIKCNVVPYLGGGIRGAGSTETFDETYENLDYARLKSSTALSKRERVTNVRNARSGLVLWVDDESDGLPTMFDVDGCAPIVNPLTGTPSEYLTTLSKSEVKN